MTATRLGLVAFALAAGLAPALASDPVPSALPARRVHERSGTIRLNGPAARTFLLFTPQGERAWAGERWDPRTVCSKNGRASEVEEGMVFKNGGGGPLWLVTRLDAAARVVEYVIVSGEILTVLHVEVAASGEDSTASVSYQWTPRSDSGEEMAAAHDRHFEETLGHWQQAMNAVLTGKPAHQHGEAR